MSIIMMKAAEGIQIENKTGLFQLVKVRRVGSLCFLQMTLR